MSFSRIGNGLTWGQDYASSSETDYRIFVRHPGEDVRWAVEGIGINCKAAEAACFGIQMKLCRTLINTQWETHSPPSVWDS